MFGEAVEDYLKAIYKLSRRGDRVSPSAVAEAQRVTPAAVTKMVRRLQDLALVVYERESGIELTPSGTKVALEMVRHHRLIELYLKEALGFPWDRVDEEAEKLEHVISEEFEERIDRALGYPTHDPHGAPIPTKDGHLHEPQHATLAELETGQAAVVERVPDGDPAVLRYLGELGLYPKTRVVLVKREPLNGPLHVRIADQVRVLDEKMAQRVSVTPLEDD